MSELQHERIAALCAELRLGALAGLYGGLAQAAVAKEETYADFLEAALKGERDARRGRAREMAARVAGFPAIKTLDAYDFGFATGGDRPARRASRSRNSPRSASSSGRRTAHCSADSFEDGPPPLRSISRPGRRR